MYSVKNTTCRCHPETCCCPEYEIVKANTKASFTVARGNDLLDLETLVVAANTVDELESQLTEAKKDQARYYWMQDWLENRVKGTKEFFRAKTKEQYNVAIDEAIASKENQQ